MKEISLEDMKNYLRIDFENDDDFINELIQNARIYIDSCVGEIYKSDEKKFNLSNILMKKLVADMYSERTTKIESNLKDDIIKTTILEKLSLAGDFNE